MIFIELDDTRTITCEAHIAPDLGACDMILGREILKELCILLYFEDESIEWDEVIIPMKHETDKVEKHFHLADSIQVDDATEHIKRILDAKYDPADLQKIVTDCTHLSPDEQQALHTLLNKHKILLDGSLGTWKNEQYKIEFKADAMSYHARAFPIPNVHEATLILEAQRLCDLGVLKTVNRSVWAAPTFIIRNKDQSVRPTSAN
jgi:hypothetical protein